MRQDVMRRALRHHRRSSITTARSSSGALHHDCSSAPLHVFNLRTRAMERLWTPSRARCPRKGFDAREELGPQEEIACRREARQGRCCGILVRTMTKHRGAAFAIMTAMDCQIIVGWRDCRGAALPCQCQNTWKCIAAVEVATHSVPSGTAAERLWQSLGG
jgi:hypothetical protein